jgi:hypothetical protein
MSEQELQTELAATKQELQQANQEMQLMTGRIDRMAAEIAALRNAALKKAAEEEAETAAEPTMIYTIGSKPIAVQISGTDAKFIELIQRANDMFERQQKENPLFTFDPWPPDRNKKKKKGKKKSK